VLKKSLVVLACIVALSLGVVVNLANRVDFTTLDGENYRWQNLQGKWVVINYFAEWCAPCLREIPQLNQFYQQNKDQLAMFAVSFDLLSQEQLMGIKSKYEIQFPVIASFAAQMPMAPPQNLPVTFLIHPDGSVAKQLFGEQSAASLSAALAALKGSQAILGGS
jgi:thiol-disulfide isomerase/thioredoxin